MARVQIITRTGQYCIRSIHPILELLRAIGTGNPNQNGTLIIMKTRLSLRKYLATGLLAAGLAYPVCAAVCPKGIGGCPTPGRCFLFTDADGNSLCDYTAGSGSSRFSPPDQNQPASSTTTAATPATTPVSSPDTAASVQHASGSGIFGTISASVLISAAVLFIVLTIASFLAIRRGVLGIRIEKTRPALALSTVFALGLSLMTAYHLSGESAAGMVFALAYLVPGTLLSAYLWHEGVMTRRVILALALESTLTGFVFLAPIMPLEFIGLVNTFTGASALTAAILVLGAVIALALVIGRTFCGHLCPVGSLQELAYAVPARKIEAVPPRALELIRLAIFVATVIAAIWLIDLMALTGLFELFSLAASGMLLVAAGLLILSVFVYRPVCRILCPFGVLFSALTGFSLFRLRRSGVCILCRKCEKACPAGCAGDGDAKRECYLCGRCTATCPVTGALTYRR